ncbi:ferritin, higher subunit-like [Acropora palmata]|uniref:ferritin, higher subunit-like n=1 Tax=Acropora palmata TaxID=6131 RepID=UPI003DA0ED61
MFTSLISLLVALHVTSGTLDCSLRVHKEFYEDNSKWVTPLKTAQNGTLTNVHPLPFMAPFSRSTSREINKQINRELFAHYTYLSMAMHFDRDDINLPGFHKFFKESAEEEMEHAQKLMKYQNMRGGRVKLHNIHNPCDDKWGNGLNAMKIALMLEKEVYESLLGLHSPANKENDPQAFHFDRDDVALQGFHKFMLKQSEEEREHASKLMKYQNKRGGRIVLQDIKKPEKGEWESALDACLAALDLEKHVNQALLDLHNVADTHGDPQTTDFITENFLEEQVESIKQFSDFVTNLKRVGPGLGEYQFDKLTLEDK